MLGMSTMRRLSIAGLLMVTLLSASAAAEVSVRFVAPDRYGERDYDVTGTRKGAFGEIRRHLESLGRRYLRPGQHLTIEVLDLDLAGEQQPWRTGWQDIRIHTGVTWPRIALRYSLRERGRPAQSGEDVLTDRMYLWNYAARASSDPLRFEKALLTDWFQRRFARQGR